MGTSDCLGEIKRGYKQHSAVCAEQTRYMICERDEFAVVFEEIFKQREEKDQLFNESLKSIKEEKQKDLFIKQFDKIKFKNKELIFDEGDEIDGLYILRKGEVKILRRNISR